MALYQYQPLKDARSIRVLKLAPSHDPTFVPRCALEEVSLDCPPKYQALSYTWGSGGLCKNICCDGKAMRVTENCKDILFQLRSKTETVVLWVDAICINQELIAERIHQVQLMGDVYKKAERVLVWLGKETEDSRLAFEILTSIPELPGISQHGPLSDLYNAFMVLKAPYLAQLNSMAQLHALRSLNRDFTDGNSAP
jgi:hypothetical protein